MIVGLIGNGERLLVRETHPTEKPMPANNDEYKRLGKNQKNRCRNYRELFKSHIDVNDIHLIRKATNYSQPVGYDRFKQEIEKKYGIELGQVRLGRPRKGG
jgi:hypothetical protein